MSYSYALQSYLQYINEMAAKDMMQKLLDHLYISYTCLSVLGQGEEEMVRWFEITLNTITSWCVSNKPCEGIKRHLLYCGLSYFSLWTEIFSHCLLTPICPNMKLTVVKRGCEKAVNTNISRHLKHTCVLGQLAK